MRNEKLYLLIGGASDGMRVLMKDEPQYLMRPGPQVELSFEVKDVPANASIPIQRERYDRCRIGVAGSTFVFYAHESLNELRAIGQLIKGYREHPSQR